MADMNVNGAGKVDGLYVAGTEDGPTGGACESTPLLSAANSLLVSGDAGAAIAALCIQTGREQKHAAQVQRRDAETLEASEQNAQIEALRDKAGLVRVQGVVDGAMTIGGAALQLGSDLSTLSSKGLNDKAGSFGKELDKTSSPSAMNTQASLGEMGYAHALADRAEGSANWLKAGHDLNAGVKEIGDGLFKGAILDKDTDATVHEQLATRAKHAVDDAMGNYDDAKKLLDKALDFYKEYSGAKNGAVSAAIHRA